jgi:O6-methylguanine-DNA--protein-cysteine methyltransferase
MTQYALFETVIGWAGVAWNDRGLAGVHLPEASPEVAHKSFLRRFPDSADAAPPPKVQSVINGIVDLLAGGKPDFADAALDLSLTPEFNARVYDIARTIPPGQTLTYGEARRQAAGARRRPGARPEPLADRRALPPGDGGQRQARRLLRSRRLCDQAEAAGDRGGEGRGAAVAVRLGTFHLFSFCS